MYWSIPSREQIHFRDWTNGSARGAMAAAGNTNAEIGATMFLSPITVDHHLRNLFQKLAISSRRQLADKLTDP